MTISPDQAADALKDVAQADARARELGGYRKGSRHFFLWGVIWMIGYGASGIDPSYSKIWLPLSLLGWAATVFMGLRTERARGINRKIGFSAMAAVLFSFAVVAIIRPQGLNEISAFPPLVLAVAYAIAGIWALPRYLWIGSALLVLTLVGFFFIAPWFSFWMAAVGGGALILGGFWLRKA